jgi:hypothetical protein
MLDQGQPIRRAGIAAAGRVALAVAVWVACLLIAAPGAGARAGHAGHQRPQRPPTVGFAFALPDQNGFHVYVYASQDREGRDSAEVQIWNHRLSTTYVARKVSVDRRGFSASFGRFGHLAVIAHRGPLVTITPECGPRHETFHSERFTGEVVLYGGEGFVAVDEPALEAEGLETSPGACIVYGTTKGGPGVTLKVLARYAGTTVTQDRPGGLVRFDAGPKGNSTESKSCSAPRRSARRATSATRRTSSTRPSPRRRRSPAPPPTPPLGAA